MNEFPRNPKPNRGDIIEITENLSGRKSKYLKVGEQFKVHTAYDNAPIFNPTKEIHIHAQNKDGDLCNIRERNYSWKIVKKCDEKLALTRDEKDSVIEYDVIEIDSCEYIMVQSRTYYDYIITNISHKGNCKYCKGRNRNEYNF